jgi:hypothetical protein
MEIVFFKKTERLGRVEKGTGHKMAGLKGQKGILSFSFCN